MPVSHTHAPTLTSLPPKFDPEAGEVVLTPEVAEAGYWIGCAGIRHEQDQGRFLLTYRQRRPRGHEDAERGWRCAVAVSMDGVTFEDVWSVDKRELGTSSMERFAVLPTAEGYTLFISYVDPADNRWRIDAIDAPTPDAFDLAGRRPVLTAASTGTEGVKDPYLFVHGDDVYMFLSYAEAGEFGETERARMHATADVYNVGITTHPTGLAISRNGGGFEWVGKVLDVGHGWDRYQARLNSVVATDDGFVGFYDGSASAEENYEERCALAVSHDLRTWTSVNPDGPWITGAGTTGSLRYFDAVPVGKELYVYYEATRTDGAHELRMTRLPLR
jgi:hypothetical protein